MMENRNKKELMMITLQKVTDYYLSILETENKSLKYVAKDMVELL